MDHERGRDFRRKKYARDREDRQMKQPIILLKSKDGTNPKTEDQAPPTILLKTRDGEKRAVSPQASSSKQGKEGDHAPVYHLAPRVTAPDLAALIPQLTEMKCSVKLLSPDTLTISEAVLEHLTDASDFLVVACLGLQGVGKSTLMSHLAAIPTDPVKGGKLFPVQSHSETGLPCTEGVEVLVTKDRLILLDAEPVLTLTRANRLEEDFDNETELASLQLAAFLLAVSHVLLIVQDYAFDMDFIRFVLTAEMLKPSSGLQSDDDSMLDYFPYVIFVHNKSYPVSYSRQNIKLLQEGYKKVFSGSNLPISSGIGVANGSVLRSLTPELCGDPINLYLLPHFDIIGKTKGFNWNIQYLELLKKLRLQILSLPPMPLTHSVLTEKNWWHYAVKVWDDIKKSKFFPEYGRLLPSQSNAKSEMGTS